MSESLNELQPDKSTLKPDLFGQAFHTLMHHLEKAIAEGDTSFVRKVFPTILTASFSLQHHVFNTYLAPGYTINSTVLDPIMDVLELSGLASLYASLREDQSDMSVNESWIKRLQLADNPEQVAKQILDWLDIVDGSFFGGISAKEMYRAHWEMRLSRKIGESGYTIPGYHPFEERVIPEMPGLIRMLGVSESLPTLSIKPRAVFAAEIIGPLTGEPEGTLRERPSLHTYYDEKDRQAKRENGTA